MAWLTWSPVAAEDLEQICEYVGRHFEQNAAASARDALDMIESIPERLRLGAIVPEYERESVHELLLRRYPIIYRIRGEDAEVIRIVHGSRSLPSAPP